MSDRREDPPPGTSLGSWKGLVPIGVAAATALVIGAGVDVVRSHQRAAKKEREAKASSEVAQTPARFVVGVTESGAALVVREIETGREVGVRVAAPPGRRFHRVAATRNGAYVVASYAGRDVTFQHLFLDEYGRPSGIGDVPRLKDVPKFSVPGASTEWSQLAVNPNGNRIAYVTYKGMRARVDVVSVPDGARKVWTTKSPGRIGSLAWSGATLSFVWSPVRSVGGRVKETKHEVRTLDTGGAGGDLRVSQALMTLPKGGTAAVFTGKGIVVGIMKDSQLSLQAYTLEGQPGEVLWQQKVKGDLTDLDPTPRSNGFLATAGDLYAQGAPGAKPVSGEDLADAAW
ncbi:hypothetical protein [Actinomadura sp. 6K520]|uniref:hypothetical protein n=1 Tax=Actinomadura sp. 6K520 TaxID=2530364 RepID=UPI0010457213|nr:hypothetical protein [Actinomadura sp. 6K520]TDE35716.1 hypothetical protein E1289_07575 [Actinomadura sp. 6K520]